MKNKKEENKLALDKAQISNLINIVATHPTPQGVGSQEGQVKSGLINHLSKMLDQLS